MEEDKIQYTTQTGETRVDVPNKRFASPSVLIEDLPFRISTLNIVCVSKFSSMS